MDMVTVDQSSIPALFEAGGTISIVMAIKEKVEAMVADVATVKGRQEIKSMAYDIAKSKTYLDGLGKKYVTQLKLIPKTVDAERREMRDQLDAMRIAVRLPLTEWEAEEAKKLDADILKIKIELAVKEALIEDDFFNREKAIKEKEEKIESERLASIAKEQAETEKRDKEIMDAAIIEKVKEQSEIKARNMIAAERLRAESEKAAAVLAERNRLEKIASDKAAAILAEKNRLEKIESDKIEAERVEKLAAEKRAANRSHMAKINRHILSCLVDLGINEDQGKGIIKAISKGAIANVTINY